MATTHPAHLTPKPEGTVLLAWHRKADAQALRLEDGLEVLWLDGQQAALDPKRHHSPVQLVINLAHCATARELADHMNALKSLV